MNRFPPPQPPPARRRIQVEAILALGACIVSAFGVVGFVWWLVGGGR